MRKVFILFLFILVGCSQPKIETPIEQDPDWVSGQLDNGMRFHIYPIEESEPVSVRLLFHIGSAQETQQQRGYAHFLEHMAFNGSKNLSSQSVVNMFEQAGLTFGSDINAYTSYYETVYELDLPDKGQLSTAMVWMRDIADGLNLDPVEIAKEIGVIQGEIRRNRPENRSFADKYYDDLIAGTLLADMDPVGTMNSVSNATAESIREFYQTWYHPQYSEIIISGDISVNEAKAIIEKQFASWQPANDVPTNQKAPITLTPSDYVGKVGEYDSPSIALMVDRGSSVIKHRQQLLDTWLDQLAQTLIFNRLDSAFNSAAIPLQGLSVTSDYINYRRYSSMYVAFAESERAEAQQMLASTLAALRDFGVSEQERDTALSTYRQRLENLDYNWQNQTSIDLVESMVASQTMSVANQSKRDYQRSLEQLLQLATQERLNQQIQQILSSDAAFILAGEDSQAVTRLENNLPALKAQFAKPGVKPIALGSPVAQLEAPTVAGDIVSKSQQQGFTVWTLSNGVEVWLEADDSAGEYVQMVYISRGGSSALESDLHAAQSLAGSVIGRSGVGDFNGSEFDAYLTREAIEVYPFVGYTHHGLEVATTKPKLMDSLNVVYNAVRYANIDPRQLEVVKREQIEDLQNYLMTPVGKWGSAINKNIYLPDSYHRLTTAPELSMVTEQQIAEVYQQLFAVNRNNKLVIVGDLTSAEVEPLLTQFIAAIPLSKTDIVPIDAGLNRKPKARIDLPIHNEQSSLYLLRATNPSASATSVRTAFIDDMVQRLIAKRLTDYVREELGLDYAPDAFSATQDSEAMTDWLIEAQVNPSDIDGIDQATEKVVQGLLNKVTQDDLDLVAKQLNVALAPLADDTVERTWFYARYLVHDYGVEALKDIDAMTKSVTLAEFRQRIDESFGENALITKYTLTPEK
ncbi:insulinase family protein [Vibrio sp. JPW-9-11-11]|uniref:M16 family metallopeptidase n=1 Tax=Vibrio sp. JPW-9-11-11 TaxID=1416532 RepID=UPI001593502C|nr:M16 family metallopeptidase [Vibrio sp. JPW-9-11-11]NVD07812.1 insulinase family protein [Vibrio sp. JPW-9-11-11]